MNETHRRLTALSAAMGVARSDLSCLLRKTNEELADLPQRLHQGPVHDDLVTTATVLTSTCEHLDRAIANIERLNQGA